MPTKRGREQIQQLLGAAIGKYERETNEIIKRNQNPDNYTGLANKLSEISNGLPLIYPKEFEPDTTGRYDITKAQIRDALFGKVDSLKPHFSKALDEYLSDQLDLIVVEPSPITPPKSRGSQLDDIMENMKVVAYEPTEAEIERLTGVWMVYNGSPQVRTSDPNRWHMVVPNIIEVKYTDGDTLFPFKRYGPNIDQKGYMKFEDKNLVSMHTYFKDGNRLIPKHSLMQLEDDKDSSNVISASWSFDKTQNVIIGIREVFIKLGNGGIIEVRKNSIEYMAFPGKIIDWKKENHETETFPLKVVSLDTLPESIQPLVNENSIILKEPNPEPPPDPNNQGELTRQKAVFRKRYTVLSAVSAILFIVALFFLLKWLSVSNQFSATRDQLDSAKHQFDTIRNVIRLPSYQPTKSEIDMLTGIWKVYTGSPQARIHHPDLRGKIALDFLEITQKERNYFKFKRYGRSFDHEGYMMFVRQNLIIIYTDKSNGSTNWPKFSLLDLNAGKDTINVLSVSWNWETPDNTMICNREVYIKIGNDGSLRQKEAISKTDLDTVIWTKKNGTEGILIPQHIQLDSLPTSIRSLVDTTSFIFKDPGKKLPKPKQ